MKTLIFKSGKSIDFVECYAQTEYVQGANRDVMDFRFNPDNITLDEIDALFTADECTKLIIRETIIKYVEKTVVNEDGSETIILEEVEDTQDFVHENHPLRVSLSKQMFTLATENGVEDVMQISVKMAQYTPTELMSAANGEQISDLQLALCEVYELMLGGI